MLYMQLFALFLTTLKRNYPNIESCEPRNCISGKINRCNRIISGVFRKYLKPFGVTNSQLSALFVITKSDGIRQQELANVLFMDKSTVNRNLKRLLESAFIKKVNGKIYTTEKGKEHLEMIIPKWNKAMTEISEILDETGLKALNTLTTKLTL